MRILHILDHSLPLHSGYTFRTANLLREQRRLGWETCHLTGPRHGNRRADSEHCDGLEFHRTAPPRGALATHPVLGPWLEMRATEQRLFELARHLLPDLLHAHSPVLDAFPALRVGRRLGIPVVYEVRAFWEDAAVDHGTTVAGSLRYQATRALETHALRHAAHVFTICEGLRGDIIARGIPAQRVTVIPNAVDLEHFRPSAAPDPVLARRLGLEDNGEVIGFVGSFYAYEGLDLLLEALPRLLQQRPGLHLLLVGGGPQEAALRARAEQLGIAAAVRFTGRVPHQEVQRYYDLIDLLVYPRHAIRLTELVTPLKPLEAMAQGRVFVASDVGGHRELIRDGETGRLFRAGDVTALVSTVEAMLKAREHWPAMRAAGRRFVEQTRNWRVSVAHYGPAYTQVLERRRGERR
ncbi:TIGR04063 family PEP-CTERM/XrtA system glycosyltransferase [Marichromatium bheemlicum]|uniref:Glycosyltransferase, exosortase A system-associated n=1 Tax=Marichromatium bheemlicum TaxID=365339 RepID=A0ABX1IB01_9GAMM|nr:TIGR04063 family PEP-CTERM/XrtA system glycosyltransferase [Marichromatium bheemlicum]NKN33372.1 glycosyltransferase, exosortase A system-associated [Marichromatium bheemlicum]